MAKVVISKCNLFRETFTEKARGNPVVAAKMEDFIKSKTADPLAPFSGKDTPYISSGVIAREVPGLRHAHLTQDISVAYKLSGKDPHILRLYAVVSHADSGTGTPGNIKIQKNFGKRLRNQVFDV